MADPLSIAGLVLAVGDVVKRFVKYCGDVRDASTEIQALNTELLAELFALQGALTTLDSTRLGLSTARRRGPEFGLMVQTTHQTLTELARALGSSGSTSQLGNTLLRLRWHWKKEDVQKHIQRVERIKSWFILLLTADTHEFSQDIISKMSQLNMNLEREYKRREADQSTIKKTQLNEAMQWLAPVEPSDILHKALAEHYPGTCRWFVDGPLADMLGTDISSGKSKVLWLTGKSGSGKTTLLGQVIQHLQPQLTGNTGMGYFFCSFDNLEAQEPVNIVGSLLHQASTIISGIGDEVVAKFNETQRSEARPSRLSLAEVEEMLVRHVKQLDRFFVVVDAVNESERKASITQSLVRLASKLGNLRLIVSSTTDHGLAKEDDGQLFTISKVEMNTVLVDDDIQFYLRNALNERSSFSPDLKLEVERSIIKDSRGTFRYARWQAENIMRQRTGRAARRALSNMPHDLNQTYSQLLGRIKSEQDRTFIRRAFLWLCCASRPLRLSELNEAIVLEEGDTDIDDECRLLDNPEFLVDLAQGLLVVHTSERGNGRLEPIVSLGHSSVKVFLTSDWIRTSSASEFAFDEPSAHKFILQTCLSYLGFFCPKAPGLACEWTLNQKPFAKLEEVGTKYPLADYATRHWPLHVRFAIQDHSCWRLVESFLYTQLQSKLPAHPIEDSLGSDYLGWVQLITGGDVDDRILQTTHPLYYASSFGYVGLVEAVLRYDQSALYIEAPGGRAGSTALQVACFRRRLEVATLLVEAGANPISLDGTFVRMTAEDDKAMYGLPSLWWAVENGSEWADLVRRMLELWAPPGSDVQEVLKDILRKRARSRRTAYGKGKEEPDDDELIYDDNLYEEIHDGLWIHPIGGPTYARFIRTAVLKDDKELESTLGSV